MVEMGISEAREHLGEVVGRARYANEDTVLTHYGQPVAAVISIEQYQKLKQANREVPEYVLPPEIMTQIEDARRHPERRQPRPRRTSPPSAAAA